MYTGHFYGYNRNHWHNYRDRRKKNECIAYLLYDPWPGVASVAAVVAVAVDTAVAGTAVAVAGTVAVAVADMFDMQVADRQVLELAVARDVHIAHRGYMPLEDSRAAAGTAPA